MTNSILSLLGAVAFVVCMAAGFALWNLSMDVKDWLFTSKSQFKDEL